MLEQLRRRAATRSNVAWERLGRPFSEYEPPAAIYQRLRLQMLAAERDSILAARDTGQLDDEILRSALNAIDMEDSLLERIDDTVVQTDSELTPGATLGRVRAPARRPARRHRPHPGQCDDCLREGTTWVHLRMCLTCGQVGCCDSSVGNHATKHYAAHRPSGHAQRRAGRGLALVLRRRPTRLSQAGTRSPRSHTPATSAGVASAKSERARRWDQPRGQVDGQVRLGRRPPEHGVELLADAEIANPVGNSHRQRAGSGRQVQQMDGRQRPAGRAEQLLQEVGLQAPPSARTARCRPRRRNRERRRRP